MKGQFRSFSLKEFEELLVRVSISGSEIYVPVNKPSEAWLQEAYQYYGTKGNGFFKFQRIRNPARLQTIYEMLTGYCSQEDDASIRFPDWRAPISFERARSDVGVAEYALVGEEFRSGIDMEDMFF